MSSVTLWLIMSLLSPPLFAELSLRGWFPLWAAVLLGLAAVAAVVVLYVREQ